MRSPLRVRSMDGEPRLRAAALAAAPRLALCRDFVQAVNAAGGKAELTLLPDIGIHSNSHMLIQDKNSYTIADWLVDWMNEHVGPKK